MSCAIEEIAVLSLSWYSDFMFCQSNGSFFSFVSSGRTSLTWIYAVLLVILIIVVHVILITSIVLCLCNACVSLAQSVCALKPVTINDVTVTVMSCLKPVLYCIVLSLSCLCIFLSCLDVSFSCHCLFMSGLSCRVCLVCLFLSGLSCLVFVSFVLSRLCLVFSCLVLSRLRHLVLPHMSIGSPDCLLFCLLVTKSWPCDEIDGK